MKPGKHGVMRGKILDILKESMDERRRVQISFREVAEKLDITAPTAQVHVHKLMELGLVNRVRQGHGPIAPVYEVIRPRLRKPKSMTATTRIEWVCDECGKSVKDGTGYIWLPVIDGREVPVNWMVHHRKCDKDAYGDDQYSIMVERFRTADDMFMWDRQISQKIWVGETDWNYFVSFIVAFKKAR